MEIKSSLHILVALVIGVLSALIIFFLPLPHIPIWIIEYSAVFIGATISAFIASRKPFWMGFGVGIILMCLSVYNLVWYTLATGDSIADIGKYDSRFYIFISNILYIFVGIIGGYVGFYFRGFIESKTKQKS